MILQDREIKRLAIYFFYDAEGIVDRYVPYLLRDLQKNISKLLIVCNGDLTPSGRQELEKITPDILIRENKGFDVWAYKEGMEFLGWDTLGNWDELLLLNSTIMGPLNDLSTMFEEMDKRDVDFWGITTHSKVGLDPFGKSKYGYIPLHLQSHFIAIRKSMLVSPKFKQYWDERPMVNTYEEAIAWHEIIFTKEFADQGFTWQAYVDTSDLENYAANPITIAPLELVKNRNCPIFKKRSFFHNYEEFISLSVGNASIDLFEYIREHSDYDVDMIWETILRTQHLADIKNCLHLNYIIPSLDVAGAEPRFSEKIALMMHISRSDSIEFCFHYAQSIPQTADVYITTDSEEKKNKILDVFRTLKCNQLIVNVIKDSDNLASGLLDPGDESILDYDYVCFVHDSGGEHSDWGVIKDAFRYQGFENLMKNSSFIWNVLTLFEKNPRLGLLMPPPPVFDDYYFMYGESWGAAFPMARRLANELGLHIPMSEEKEPIAPFANMFWFRPLALKQWFKLDVNTSKILQELKDGKGSLLRAIVYLYPFVAQQAGYYSAWLMADSFARIDITNKNYVLAEINKRAFQIYGTSSHYGLVTTIQSTILDGTAQKNTDRALKALLVQRLKRASPIGIWNFLRKIYYLARQKMAVR